MQKKWILVAIVAAISMVGMIPAIMPMPKVLQHHVVKPVFNPIEFLIDQADIPVSGVIIRPQTTEELNKWFAGSDENHVPRVFVDKMPPDFVQKGRPEVFSRVIAALILRNNEKIVKERIILSLLQDKANHGKKWTPKEKAYFDELVQRYDSWAKKVPSAQMADLMMKVYPVPPVMGILQAAEATDWGKAHWESPFEQTGWLDRQTFARVPYESLIQATDSYVAEVNGMPPLTTWRYARYLSASQGHHDIGYRVIRWLGEYKQGDSDYIDRLSKRADEYGDYVWDTVSFIKPHKMQQGKIKIGPHVFDAEFARTQEERMNGLMFRPQVPAGTGMIFLNEAPRPMGVWMKNTFVPLDVLFFNKEYKITDIFENLKPLDETPRQPAIPVLGMVELPAGTVQQKNIKIGDKISF
ncbi:MAG: DUF192 domain-containing protein [Pseudomonadota bacterium]|nr:DUF192 domain-containing protein [Pseudomonadota bacterium]